MNQANVSTDSESVGVFSQAIEERIQLLKSKVEGMFFVGSPIPERISELIDQQIVAQIARVIDPTADINTVRDEITEAVSDQFDWEMDI